MAKLLYKDVVRYFLAFNVECLLATIKLVILSAVLVDMCLPSLSYTVPKAESKPKFLMCSVHKNATTSQVEVTSTVCRVKAVSPGVLKGVHCLCMCILYAANL